MIVAVAVVYASARAEGEAAEAAGRWAEALEAWRRCVAEGPDLDRRFCATREAVLAPQAADDYAGWEALERIRREYRSLGGEAALTRMEAALAAHPDSPAAGAMRAWIAHERSSRGEHDAARAVLPPDAPMRVLVDAREATARSLARQRGIGTAGAALGGVFLGVAGRGPGAVRPARGLAAALLLGVLPGAIAASYAETGAGTVLAVGAWLGLAVALAPRAPAWLGALGALGGVAFGAWRAGWLGWMGA